MAYQQHPLRVLQNMASLLIETDPEKLWSAMKVVRQSDVDVHTRLAGP